jgi:hypothetical protein
MALGKRLINTSAADAACFTDDVNPFTGTSADSGVALYSLDYDASEASDSYDGTPTNVEFGVGGQINYGARFNGSSSYIDLPNLGTDVSGSNTRTLSAWVNLDANPSIYSAVFSYGTAANKESFGLYITSTGTPRVSYYNLNYDTSTTLTLGNWHHIVAIYKGGNVETSTNTELYIDGQIQTITKTGGLTGLINTSNSNYSIGYYKDTPANSYFNGSIDQVRIFSKALSSDEVDTLYAETACVYDCTTDDINYPFSDGTNVEAYYKLDNSAEDETGSYDGTESNIEYRFGRYGQAAVFNGIVSASRSKITTSGLTTYNNFSISFWLNPDDVNNTRLIMGTSESFLTQTGFGVFFGLTGNGNLTWRVSNGTSAVDIEKSSISTGNWHHIVITQNTSNNEKKLYVNGNLETTSTSTINTTGQAYSLIIGGYNTYNNTPYDGDIDQVRIYSTALTDSQVTQLYEEKQCYITKDAADPFGDSNSVALYEMENNANDSSGNGNNGIQSNVQFTTTDPIRGVYEASFNGSSSRINTGYQIPSGLSGFSVSAWVKAASVKTQFIVGDLGTGGESADGMFQINISSSNKLRAAVGGTGSQNIATLSNYIDTWTHIVVTTDSSGNIIGYVNGSQVGTATGNSLTANTKDFVIGTFGDVNHSTIFNGDLDQVRIFDRELDGTEAYQLYAEGVRGTGL